MIDELAKLIIQENSQVVGDDIAEEAIRQIEKEKMESEGGTKENVQEKKTKRGRKPRTISQ